MTTGQKIYELRKNAHITQEQFADKLNVTRQAVSKWESDAAYPETDKIAKIAELFGVSCDYLLKDDAEINDGILAERRRSYLTMMVSFALACVVVGYVVAIICYFCIDMSESPLIGLGVFAAFLLGAFALWQAGRYHFLNTCDYSEKDKAHLARFTKVYYYVSIIAFFCYLPAIIIGVGGALTYLLSLMSFVPVGYSFARIIDLIHSRILGRQIGKSVVCDVVILTVVTVYLMVAFVSVMDMQLRITLHLLYFRYPDDWKGVGIAFGTVLPVAIMVQVILHKIFNATPSSLFAMQLLSCLFFTLTWWFSVYCMHRTEFITMDLFIKFFVAMLVLTIIYGRKNAVCASTLRLSIPIYIIELLQYYHLLENYTSLTIVIVNLALISSVVAILYAIPFRARKK